MKRTKFLLVALAATMVFASCKKEEVEPKDDDAPQEEVEAVVGKWRSPEVAPILVDYVDSIHVEFRANNTYLVESFKDGAITELEGTYVTSDGVGAIRNIVLEQSSPTTLTSTGIYEVTGNTMKYEVAQTEPAQAGVTAPTAEAGFGSTSDGAFGEMNVQVYYKMN